MKKEYSLLELVKFQISGLPSTHQGIQKKATNENWPFREVDGKGGKGGKKKLFTPPQYVLDAIKAQAVDQILAETASAPLPALPEEKAIVHHLNDRQRLIESARMGVLNSIETVMKQAGCTKVAAMQTVLTQSKLPGFEHIAKQFELARDTRGAEGDLPSIRTLKRWFAQRGENDLAPKVVEANFTLPTWFKDFLKFYQQPQNPEVTLAYDMFCAMYAGTEAHSIHKCRRWLNKMGAVSREKGRKGYRELKLIKAIRRRSFKNLLPSDIYSADGHTFDAEVIHPYIGKPFRPEITSIVDIATRKCVGFSIDTAESGLAVLAAITDACINNGIPAEFYVDNGKGYKNAMMTDDATGLMGRLGTTMQHSLPYESQARGVIERFHKTVWVRAAKMLPTYMGADMDKDAALQAYKATRNIANGKYGKVKVLSWDDFKAICEQSIAWYNNRPHRSLQKITDESGKSRHMTPNEMWAAKLESGATLTIVDADESPYLFRPQVIRVTKNGEISFSNKKYFSRDLEEYYGQDMRISYDVRDAQYVWVYDDLGRFICKAELDGNVSDYRDMSEIELKRDKREVQRIKRKQRDIDVIESARKPKMVEAQEVINLGGISYTQAQIKAEAAKITAQQAVEHVTKVEKVKPVVHEQETIAWRPPAEPKERFELYLQIYEMDNPPVGTEKWLKSYPKSHEFKAFMNSYFKVM